MSIKMKNIITKKAEKTMNETNVPLIKAAKKAMAHAYVPYSNFKVGAALLTNEGEIYVGCNIENASFGLTNCAERTALFKAISEGERTFSALCVIADSDRPISPCGACRQVIAEFCEQDMQVILTNLKGDRQVTTVSALLPNAFTAGDFDDK